MLALAHRLLGLLIMVSASPERLGTLAVNTAVALVVMWVAARIPPQRLMSIALPLYVIGIAAARCGGLFGDVSKGARRWLNIGFMRIQPSEIMKIAMPLMLAWYFQKHEAMLRPRDWVVAGADPAAAGAADRPPARPGHGDPGLRRRLLRDLPGRAVLEGHGHAGLRRPAPACPVAWTLLHDYQRQRILTLLDPEADPLGKGFHIIQSTIAVGSGGILGKGWGNGTQTHLEFIPERHTDFIFAVLSEEFGLLGNSFLLVLYALMIGRGLMIAANAPTCSRACWPAAITLIFFTYAFVNMGMVSGILPVVGVPLPFVSYGGTALVTLFVGVGILMSIHKHRMLVQK
jgi:rod shape determining protein RodA